MVKNPVLYLLLLFATLHTSAQPQSLLTTAEGTDFLRTGRYEQMVSLCANFQSRWPEAVRVYDFGLSPQGRPLKAMVVSLRGFLTPEQARKNDVPVVVVQGCIHAGEVDGKDAGFIALRELLEKEDSALKNSVVVFIPIFNVDGHERFKAWNRPNQNGPEEMGWRVTSQNLNLNRDYTKADATEMRSMLDLLNAWDPILYVDLHATDGARFQPDVAVLVEPKFVGAEGLQALGKRVERELLESLAEQSWMALSFYPSLDDHNDPKSGFRNSAFPPRFSGGYWALRNRLSVLVETHSWKDYETRVKVTRDILFHLLSLTASHGSHWMKEAVKADAQDLSGQQLPLSYETTEKTEIVDFPGYSYRLEDSHISGAKALIYDPKSPENWRMPFYGEIVTDRTAVAPEKGYLIPRSLTGVVGPLLTHHNIVFEELSHGDSEMTVEVFRATKVEQSGASFEGRQTTQLEGDWQKEKQEVLEGSLFIPIRQPKARLVVALLEPEAPDSLAYWGFFNAFFEQKEYMEQYVAEEEALKMLEQDPKLAAEFQQRLQEDEEFRNNPKARLNFFYERHPSWDTRMNLYPIFRVPAESETQL